MEEKYIMQVEELIEAYADGSEISCLEKTFNMTYEEIQEVLAEFRDVNRYKRTFTDEFKIIIAERDLRKFPRSQIAKDFGINGATVKKACEQFGEAIKKKASSDNVYSVVDGVYDLKTCPTCDNHKVNEIDSISDNVNTKGIYCMECGDEHFLMHKYIEQENEDGETERVAVGEPLVHRVNFEYFDE